MSKPARKWRLERHRSPIRSRAAASRPRAVDPAARMRAAASWPLDECLVSTTWAAGTPITVVWIRRHPTQARYAVATFQADLQGGGLTRATGQTDVGRAAAWSAIEAASSSTRMVRCDPSLAVKLLYGALERAPRNAADPDWLWVSEILGNTDPGRCPVPLPPQTGRTAEPAGGRSLAEHLRRSSLAMFSPVSAADA